jgi:hypothetical protein
VVSMESSLILPVLGIEISGDQASSNQALPAELQSEVRSEPTTAVDGSVSRKIDGPSDSTNSLIANDNLLQQPNKPGNRPPEQGNGSARLSPNTRTRLSRQNLNGSMSPLDIGSSGTEVSHDDFPHLSPVYEARTPSPTTIRKFDPSVPNGRGIHEKDNKLDFAKVGSNLGLSNSSLAKQTLGESKPNGHIRAAKSEGSPGNWQKIVKSKKKGASAELKGDVNGQPQSEKQPRNDSERKGG